MSTTQEVRIEAARQQRVGVAREYAKSRGLSRQAGEGLARARELEPDLNLTVLDHFPMPMAEAAAAIMPRAAYGPDHEPQARRHLAMAARMARTGRDRDAAHWLAEAGQGITRAGDRRAQANAQRDAEACKAAAGPADLIIGGRAGTGMSPGQMNAAASPDCDVCVRREAGQPGTQQEAG